MEINSQFTQFVQFARAEMSAGHTKAIARDAGSVGALGGRSITAATGDKVAPLWRRESNKIANNAARDLFRSAIISMFGSEKNIPASVKDAMLMKDYDKGKPLTARRIIAVTTAITNESAELSQKLELELAKTNALSKGFTQTEVESMVRDAGFVADALGCTKAEAFTQVSTAGSKVNRLLTYSGRFAESAQNFREGMRLLDSFNDWFMGVTNVVGALNPRTGKRTEDMNKTLLNAAKDTFTADKLRSVEKFVFEQLAHDPAANLSETDPERIFGMENNPASHFFGLNLCQSCAQTVAQMPHDKRALLYRAVNLFFPLADNAADANKISRDRGVMSADCGVYVVGRLLKHFDEVAQMEASGNLRLQDLIKLCFPELPQNGPCGLKELDAYLNGLDEKMSEAINAGKMTVGQFALVPMIMQTTACTFDEAVEAANGGKSPTPPKYLSSGTLQLSAYDGTTNAARMQLKTDLKRPYNYTNLKTGQKSLIPPQDLAFKFSFPGGETIPTNGTAEGMANIDVLLNKIESFCGKTRQSQSSAVMMMLSQSGIGVLNGGLTAYGISSTEHSACNFALSRNEETGDVTIRYSSPESLPFSFEWSATVTIDGTVTTTPFQFHE